ncbi:MAG TPA: hypothetical protein VGF14_01450 [Alphaproteobacteria bacterium]
MVSLKHMSCLVLSVAFLGACNMMNRDAGNYGNVSVSYPGATIHKANGTGCDTSGNVVRQNNPNCVGKTLGSDRNGPTITVLQPGAAVPVETVDTGNLAPPPR